jgi:Mid-1-related chloride channel (MCLC)
MLFTNGPLFAYVVCACLIGFEAKEQDESDWLDPNDLINYDPISRTMRSRQNSMVFVAQLLSIV